MKSKLATLLLLAAALPATATITMNTQFGAAFKADGTTLVADGTLWALVIDSDSSNSFYGGFGLDQSITNASLVSSSAFATSQALTLGSTLGSTTDKVIALGGFSGAAPGITTDAVELAVGTNGVVAGAKFAFYWFPNVSYTSGTNSYTLPASSTSGAQFGGMNSTIADGIFDTGMVIPADGALSAIGAATASNDGGGSLSNARFTAAVAVPETSSALLGAIGALGLLRRRRN